MKKPDEESNITIVEHLIIKDADSQKIITRYNRYKETKNAR